MVHRLFVATRKGLQEYKSSDSGWAHAATHFLGDPVTNLLVDDRDNALYAALDLGHFGVKLHRSSDGDTSWQELEPPKYLKGESEDAPSPMMIWTLAAGGADQPGRLWAGTLPGGLFRSDDKGETWSTVYGPILTGNDGSAVVLMSRVFIPSVSIPEIARGWRSRCPAAVCG